MKRRLLLAAVIATALSGAAPPAAAEEKLFFSRDFPGSVPAYFDVTLTRGGAAVYREAVDDEFPVEFQVEDETVEKVFALFAALDLSQPIASQRKVAFTGDKVLRYESPAGETAETTYVYTEIETAAELTSWFLKATETERHFIELERVLRFDRLGVNDALLSLQKSFNRDRVIAPKQFVALLEKIVRQKRIVHLARARASALIERINGVGSAVR